MNHEVFTQSLRGGVADRYGKPICFPSFMEAVRGFWERRGMEVPVGEVRKSKKRVKVKAHTRRWPS